MEDHLLSRAMIAFLGIPGRIDRKSPEDRVTGIVGSAAVELVPRIRSIMDELRATGIQWNSRTIAEMGQRAETWLKAHHPELSDEAVDALANDFAFNYK